MRRYKMKETEEISVRVVNSRPEEEVLSVDHTWGYFSEKDGERHSFDLCESCYDKLLASFKIPADVRE